MAGKKVHRPSVRGKFWNNLDILDILDVELGIEGERFTDPVFGEKFGSFPKGIKI